MMVMEEQRPSTGFPESMLGVGNSLLLLIPSMKGEHCKVNIVCGYMSQCRRLPICFS